MNFIELSTIRQRDWEELPLFKECVAKYNLKTGDYFSMIHGYRLAIFENGNFVMWSSDDEYFLIGHTYGSDAVLGEYVRAKILKSRRTKVKVTTLERNALIYARKWKTVVVSSRISAVTGKEHFTVTTEVQNVL